MGTVSLFALSLCAPTGGHSQKDGGGGGESGVSCKVAVHPAPTNPSGSCSIDTLRSNFVSAAYDIHMKDLKSRFHVDFSCAAFVYFETDSEVTYVHISVC